MFNWFSNKKEVEAIKEDTKVGFEAVKKDILSVTGWIKHLDSEKNMTNSEINSLKEEIASLNNEIENIKNIISIVGNVNSQQVFKTNKRLLPKQTADYDVRTAVSTPVQTPNLDNFSITERAIILVLLNSDLKLSHEDLAAMLGKEKATIRGQINSIKQKSEDLILEQIEQNGKKRVYISEEMKEKLLKKQKVRVNVDKKPRKNEEND
jgi:prophage DNA circulation protein